MKQIWMCLAERPVYPHDREQCFRWFADVRKPVTYLRMTVVFIFRLSMTLDSNRDQEKNSFKINL